MFRNFIGRKSAVPHKKEVPDVSIIIPTYNVEKYIEQCLRSLLAQKYEKFEIICIDDGSDDHTVAIIKKYMNMDGRIRLYELPHCGKAGVMRNFGMEKAEGEYCLFLDGDDFFEPELVGHTLKRIREDQSDICLFDARLYYEKSGNFIDAGHMLKKEYVPQTVPFEGKKYPYVFNISTGCPWTKLYRKSFIKEHNLQFMETHRSNDLYFVCVSLALAKRITVLEEKLVNYRKSSGSLQANNASSPWDWYEALKAVKKKLTELGIYQEVEASYKNYVLDVSFYNLESMGNAEVFSAVYEKLQKEVFQEFGMENLKKEEINSWNEKKYEQYLQLKADTEKEYLFYKLKDLKKENQYWMERARKAEQDTKSNIVYITVRNIWIMVRRILRKKSN